MPFTHSGHYPYSTGGTADESDLNNIENGVAGAYTELESITANDGITLPSSDGPFTLANFISYLSKVIRNITGKANWYDTPDATIASLNTSVSSLSSGKLDASSYTASDVLAKVKTVDGSGSGLDADTLDGSDSAAFAKLASAANFTSSLQKSGKNVVFANSGLSGKFDALATQPSSPADGDLWLDLSTVLG